MSLIIDGYNLMHAAGIVGRGAGPGFLERSRLAVLNFVVESLEPAALATTTVVFDARQAPPGLPREWFIAASRFISPRATKARTN